ncbi:MAG: EAL domain-containing protein [Actinomycetes bacterium]
MSSDPHAQVPGRRQGLRGVRLGSITPTWYWLLALAAAVTCVYWVLGLLGDRVVYPAAELSLFWAPTAFGLAMVARFGGLWLVGIVPGLVIGEFLLVLRDGVSVNLVVLFVAVNVGEQVLIGLLLRAARGQRMTAARDVVLLFGIAAVVLAFTSLIGGMGVNTATGGAFFHDWWAWFFGSITAVLIAAPFFLTVRIPRRVGVRLAAEYAFLTVVAVSLTWWVFIAVPTVALPLGAVLAPLLGWIGFRFGLAAAAGLASVVVYLAAVSGGILLTVPAGADEFVEEIGEVMAMQLTLVLFYSTVYAAVILEHARRSGATAERAAHEQLRLMFADSPAPLCRVAAVKGEPGVILEVNSAFALLLASAPSDIEGRSATEFLHPGETRQLPFDTRLVFDAQLGHSQDLPDRSVERRLVRSDGEPIWASISIGYAEAPEPGAEGFFVLSAQDVTARHDAEMKLLHQANFDPLTDLRNRYALLGDLQRLLRDGGREASQASLLLCDLDGLKDLNDTLGHRYGDEVLKVVARRLQTIGEVGILGRFGGDQFLMVLPGSRSESDVLDFADRVRGTVAMPISIDGQPYVIGVRIGIVRCGLHAMTVGDLLRRADLALRAAKAAGRFGTRFYQDSMELKLMSQVEMQEEIRKALDENRVECWLQPIVDPRLGMMTSAEALVRIRRVDGSILNPGDFIKVAETSGLIAPLGARMLELALGWLVAQGPVGIRLPVSVNASIRQLTNPGFARRVLGVLKRKHVEPSELIIEVTEAAALDEAGAAVGTLVELHQAGVQIALDDFGTGYSSLTALRLLPADVVKIDRIFIRNMLSEPDDYAIVAAVINVAHSQGRTVVAEGIELVEQADALVMLDCDRLQGFYFGRPVPSAEFEHSLFPPIGRTPGVG